MTQNGLKTLRLRLRALTVFRNLQNDAVLSGLMRLLDCIYEQAAEHMVIDAYAEFVSQLFQTDSGSLGEHIRCIVNDDENVYIRMMGRGETPPDTMTRCVTTELNTLQQVANLTPSKLMAAMGIDLVFLPDFEVASVKLAEEYAHRVQNIGVYGYGMYARSRMFYINSQNHIVPVRNPDCTRLSELVDYQREKKIIMDNTIALLEGKPAANILLTGDAGTGKSSTVKAVVNELHHRGLRILEVRKEQLREIPAILDELHSNPLKFILFIDDLSFQKDDDNFSALKAILEGSVSAKSGNVVIYATSNRRHLVKETFSDREGDDIHRNDTMQEIISLSERFGIHITFQKPDKKTYLDIVRHLATERGITMDPAQLELLAERYALGRGGRSARAATQFVDGLASQQNM